MAPIGTTSSTTDEGRPREQEGENPADPPISEQDLDEAGVLSRAVRGVLLEVGRRIAGEGRITSARREAVSSLLRIGRKLEGLTSPGPDDGGEILRAQLLERRLADAVRDELLALPIGSGAPAEPGEVLHLLRRLGDLQRRAWGGEELAVRLTEPDAFELIVEVAHDLRSPLTSVLFLAETLRAGHSGEVNDLQRSQLGLIYSAALGMVSIASDVMELARGGTRLPDDALAPFAVSEIFETVREVVRPMAEVKGIELRFRPPMEDRRIGHPIPLSRILLNLTTNALKFTDEGFVEISAEPVGRSDVLFSVRDTGRGIDARNQQALYEPFKKSEHRSGHFFSGSGLGLSIARRLVEALGADLEFETGPDWGTRFFFRLALPVVSTH
jgi:signal transduction histidine kinase